MCNQAFHKSLLASCIAAGVANAAIQKGAPGKVKIEIPPPEKRYHPQWAVPKVLKG
jgi:hypothetical protein